MTADARVNMRFSFLLVVLIATILCSEYLFAVMETIQLQLAFTNGRSFYDANENMTDNKRLKMLRQQMEAFEKVLNKKDGKYAVKVKREYQKLEKAIAAVTAELQGEPPEEPQWMEGLTKSLVAIQLAVPKMSHYEMFVKPSWNRLVFDPSTSKVVADLFIACHPDACHVLDSKCRQVNSNTTRLDLMTRSDNELLCLYAPVPEKKNESYQFAHSLNFLQMQPFERLLNLNYYDYILRSDADAILLPGLLRVVPTGDGWIGAGFYGTKLTDGLVEHYGRIFLPALGAPLRPNETTPSMQSTFYVHKSKFRFFVSVLLIATKTLYEKAFTEEVCKEINNLEITKKLYGKNETVNFCRWADWHQGVSSLYGTRIAVDHVLENVTVTGALDAMATSFDAKDVSTTIQAHMLLGKYGISSSLGNGAASGLCEHPLDTLGKLKKMGHVQKKLGEGMENVYRDRSMANKDTFHYLAEILFDYFHKIECQKKD